MLNILAAAIIVVLTAVKGPAPLHTTAQITVTGPYEGAVCVFVVQEETPVSSQMCAQGVVELAPGSTAKVDIELVGSEAGTWEIVGILPDTSPTVFAEPVTVVVE